MSKKRVLLTLKVLLSGGLIWFLFQNVDTDMAVARVQEMAIWPLAITVGLFVFQALVANLRWLIALRAIEAPMPFWRALAILYIGIFFNQTLPSSVGGDAVRMYKTYKAGLPLSAAINGVMLDRIATVVALVLVVLVLQPFLVVRVEDPMMQLVIPLLTAGAVGGVVVLMLLDRMPETFHRWKVVRGMAYLAADTRRLFLSPRWAPLSIGISAFGHVNISIAVYFLARALGIEITVLDCVMFIPLVILVTTLPISIAGWGVREGAMVGALALIGVPGESSLVLSIMMGLVAVLVSLPGGIVFLVTSDKGGSLNMDEIEATVSAEGTQGEAHASRD